MKQSEFLEKTNYSFPWTHNAQICTQVQMEQSEENMLFFVHLFSLILTYLSPKEYSDLVWYS